jgi:DNA-directed RNA polymerase specialized sigma subunit
MAYSAAEFSLNKKVKQRDAIRYYLADLPLLDRRVLYDRHAKRKTSQEISEELRISRVHVEHILSRAQAFVTECKTAQGTLLSPFPVQTRSPISLW